MSRDEQEEAERQFSAADFVQKLKGLDGNYLRMMVLLESLAQEYSGDSAAAREIGARHPYTDGPRDWSHYKRQREELDKEIRLWCDSLSESDVSQGVKWMRGDTLVETNFGFNLVHMFNHTTHHRGQVHAMLTSAGIDPGSTDLPMLPDDV